MGNDSNQLNGAVSLLLDKVTLSGNARYSEGGNAEFSLGIEFSFDRSRSDGWHIRGTPLAAHGRARAKVYLDNNANGVFDEADEPFAGARFVGRKEWEDQQTNANGEIFLHGLRADGLSLVELDTASLEDPFLKPAFEKRRLVAHAGSLRNLDIPVLSLIHI